MSKPRKVTAAASAAGLALLLAACGGGSSSNTVTVTEGGSAKPTSNGGGSSLTLPAAPAGAKELQSEKEFGGLYTRYEITGTTPQQVNDDYKAALEKDGYTIKQSGGGGGGWGKWGGSEFGTTAEKSGSYASVQAGGSKTGPTYYEVCVGPDASILKACENISQGPDSSTYKS